MKRIDKLEIVLEKIEAVVTPNVDWSWIAATVKEHVIEARKLVARRSKSTKSTRATAPDSKIFSNLTPI